MTTNTAESDVTEVAEAASSNPITIDKTSLAWKVFNALVEDKQISATADELLNFLTNELKIYPGTLPAIVRDNLSVIVVSYINMWSGWHFKNDFLAGKFKPEHYYLRFYKFLSTKLTAIGKQSFCNALQASLNQEEKTDAGKSSLEAVVRDPEFSPYAILLQCPPQMLNTLVFSNVGDDVIMKQHLGSNWHDLSTLQLLNWPHVEVTFRSEDISFTRRQATEFVRYLNFLPHECKKHNDDVIEHAETLHSYGRKRSCYSYNYVEEYSREYLKALKTVDTISADKIEEITTILCQFLEDIKHINVNKSIATNTVVLFRLCQVPFIRNKKLVKNSSIAEAEARVGYCEIITPKIELVLLYLKAVQKDTPHISFEYTDHIRNSSKTTDSASLLPAITYKCTFCKVDFITSNAKTLIMEHLKSEHKMEQHVRCTICKNQFEVLNLAACRWRHKCSPAATNSQPTSIILN